MNLYLKILGRDANGYHPLITIFHRIALFDFLKLKKSKKGFSLSINRKDLTAGEENIITKAYRLLQREFPGLGGVQVHLTKNIPLAAGLGGGSGNAATFLLGMKKLYKLRISQSKLLKVGGQLGADVPFFLSNINQALGLGYGDKIVPLQSRRKYWFVLAVSGGELSTRRVYQSLPKSLPRLNLTKEKRTVKLIRDLLNRGSTEKLTNALENDLEKAALLLKPSLSAVIAKFQNLNVPKSMVSGSGPTVFAILKNKREADRVIREFKISRESKYAVLTHTW